MLRQHWGSLTVSSLLEVTAPLISADTHSAIKKKTHTHIAARLCGSVCVCVCVCVRVCVREREGQIERQRERERERERERQQRRERPAFGFQLLQVLSVMAAWEQAISELLRCQLAAD